MKRDWDLIWNLLAAIDVDYKLDLRDERISLLVKDKGVKKLNYHLCLLYEAGLVQYFRPLYSISTDTIEAEPIQLTKEGVKLLRLINKSKKWEDIKMSLNWEKNEENLAIASGDVLFDTLRNLFLSTTIAK